MIRHGTTFTDTTCPAISLPCIGRRAFRQCWSGGRIKSATRTRRYCHSSQQGTGLLSIDAYAATVSSITPTRIITKDGATVPKDTKAIHTSEMDAKVLLSCIFLRPCIVAYMDTKMIIPRLLCIQPHCWKNFFMTFCPVRLADKPWLKVLLADLL